MTVKLNQVDVDKLFDVSTHQSEIVIGLYKLVVPDWDKVVKMNTFPACSNATWHYICRKFIEFDRVHHPDVLPGGCWMNHGFSVEVLPDWEVSTIVSEIEYSKN